MRRFMPKQVDVAAELARRTEGRGVDVAVEAVGITDTVATAVRAVRKGGAVALVGNLAPQIELPLQAVVTREITLYGSCASAAEYPQCLDFIARGAIQVDPIISAVVPLAEAGEWFHRLHRGGEGLVEGDCQAVRV